MCIVNTRNRVKFDANGEVHQLAEAPLDLTVLHLVRRLQDTGESQ